MGWPAAITLAAGIGSRMVVRVAVSHGLRPDIASFIAHHAPPPPSRPRFVLMAICEITTRMAAREAVKGPAGFA